MTSNVELIYFTGCPNIESARESLRAAFEVLGQPATWQEWNLDDTEAPERVRGFASPSVLVGGVHVLGDEPSRCGANACSAFGAPAAEVIVSAVRGSS